MRRRPCRIAPTTATTRRSARRAGIARRPRRRSLRAVGAGRCAPTADARAVPPRPPCATAPRCPPRRRPRRRRRRRRALGGAAAARPARFLLTAPSPSRCVPARTHRRAPCASPARRSRARSARRKPCRSLRCPRARAGRARALACVRARARRRRAAARRRRAGARAAPTLERRRRHRHAALVAADRDPDHHREHHRRADRADDQRHRRRGRAQVPAEPAGAQALHRRLRPRRAVDARLGHRQQRALAGLRRRHPAVQPARQRRQLHAALGPGHAGGDRARRRALRAVLGRLSGQLGGRGRRLRHAHADALRGARQAAGLHASTSSSTAPTRATRGGAGERLARQPRAARSSWWLNVNRLDSDAQPLVLRDQAARHGDGRRAGTPVTGAVADATRATGPGACSARRTQTHTVQDHAKLKLAYDFTPTLRASYTFGLWRNDADRDVETLPARRRRQRRVQRRGGSTSTAARYTLAADRLRAQTAATGAPDARPVAQDAHAAAPWTGKRRASLYDYARDIVRSPRCRCRGANAGGAGRITDQDGTGWNTLALKGIWRPQAPSGAHLVDFGVQRDALQAAHAGLRHAGLDRRRAGGALLGASSGNTALTSLWAQDAWRFAPRWQRRARRCALEHWRAVDGATRERDDARWPSRRAASATLAEGGARVPGRATTGCCKASARPRGAHADGRRAVPGHDRRPTTIVNNDPNLKPEKSWTSELTAERDLRRAARCARRCSSRTRATRSTRRPTSTVGAERDQHPERRPHPHHGRRDRRAGAATSSSSGLDLSGSVTYADSTIVAERQRSRPASASGSRACRAGAPACWRRYAPDERWSASARRALQRAAVQHARQRRPQRLRLHRRSASSSSPTCALRYRFDRHWSAAVGIDNLNNYRYWNFHPYPQRTYNAELRFDL